MLESSYWLTYL